MLVHRPAVSLETDRPTVAVRWEETSCPQCGRGEESLILEAPDPLPSSGTGLWFAVVRCNHCGLSYTNPRPSPESIGQFYPHDYPPHRVRRRDDARASRPIWSALFGRPCNERRGVLPWQGSGRLLDFGCGSGGFLRRMAGLGWRVTGLDAASTAARQAGDFPVHVGSLPHPELTPGSFDIVTMWHSLEHVHQPLAVLREARRVLVPGGRIFVAVPNIESLPFYLFSRCWYGLDLPRHLTHFAPKTLRTMLETAGFRVESVRSIRHSDWLRSSARLAQREGRGGLVSRFLRTKPLSKLAAWSCYAMGLSDCILATAQRP